MPQVLFKTDNVEYTLVPVESKDQMRLAYEDYRHSVSHALTSTINVLIHNLVSSSQFVCSMPFVEHFKCLCMCKSTTELVCTGITVGCADSVPVQGAEEGLLGVQSNLVPPLVFDWSFCTHTHCLCGVMCMQSF